MTKRAATYLASAAILGFAVLSAPRAEATYIVTFEQIGSTVAETGGGTIDTTDLDNFGSRQGVFPQIEPNLALFVSGTEFSLAALYSGAIAGPTSFGSGGMTSASSSNGDGIVLLPNENPNETQFALPEGYMSGSPLRKLRPISTPVSLRSA